MSNNNNILDQSLDEIMKDAKPTNSKRGRGGRRVPGARTKAVAPPVGGINKNTRAAKAPVSNNANNSNRNAAPAGRTSGESKILVSNLPDDIVESQLKDYFSKVIGPVKKVLLTYGPNGKSRGVATIIFANADSASKAVKTQNNIKVDQRPMRIEVIVGASDLAAPAQRKSLSDRISQPKNAAKPKPATNAKPATNGAKKEAAGNGKKTARGRNAGRPKPKTAEELDAEMQDYFGGNTNGTAATTNGEAVNGANGATNGGDVGMDDEIL